MISWSIRVMPFHFESLQSDKYRSLLCAPLPQMRVALTLRVVEVWIVVGKGSHCRRKMVLILLSQWHFATSFRKSCLV